MKRTLAISIALLFVMTTLAFGHAGEVHTYMGTLKSLLEDGFTMQKTDGKVITVLLSDKTTYQHVDGKVAKRSDLKAGQRVVAKISTDGKTALTVKMASG